MSNQIDQKEILTAFIEEVWNAGNADGADKYLAATYTIHHDPGDPWEHKALSLGEYKERVRVSCAPFPDQKFEIQELFDGENAVVMTWFWKGTHAGDFPGFPVTGRVIRMSGATVYYFDGERITGHWQITDRLGVYQQLSG